jgi:hypothetical protein
MEQIMQLTVLALPNAVPTPPLFVAPPPNVKNLPILKRQ